MASAGAPLNVQPPKADEIVDLPKGCIAVTCIAPVNIAVVKYWGKRDEVRILPINSSLSGTIHTDSMRSFTTIIACKDFDKDVMFLNGKEEDLSKSKRLQAVLSKLRDRAEDYTTANGQTCIKKGEWASYKLRILSFNNFPTAAGLASSASGFACLTKCLAHLFGFKEAFDGELTAFARQGSGSACRSLHSGFVKWDMGSKDDGADSYAIQVAPASHWPEMRVIILVANGGAKETPSTVGMETSVLTSDLLKHRMDNVVPKRMSRMEQAIMNKNFAEFAEETMKDSNQFHAVCADTFPPIFYLNETSKRIIHIVHTINALSKSGPICAYTFDAGPNAVIYTLDAYTRNLVELFDALLRPADKQQDAAFIQDKLDILNEKSASNGAQLESWKKECGDRREDHKIYSIIVSKLGEGATIIAEKNSF